jgi:hypothetical protein
MQEVFFCFFLFFFVIKRLLFNVLAFRHWMATYKGQQCNYELHVRIVCKGRVTTARHIQ